MLTRLLLSAAVVIIPVAGAFAAPQGGPPASTSFVPMKGIIVPIVDAEVVDGLLHVDIVLETATNEDAAKLTSRLASLRAASVAAALDFSALYASGRAPVNAERLRTDLETALRQDNPEIARVLVVEVAATVA